MNCHKHHKYYVTQCEKCKDDEYFARWAEINDLEDFVPTDHAKVLITVGACLVAIAALAFILEY